MNQLQHPLEFVHKFNLFKLSGLLIDENDLASIARVYGVPPEELERLEERFRRNVAELAGSLPPARRAPAEPALSVLAIGDSITSDRESYVKILNRYWQHDSSRQISDSAVSGDTTADLIKRFYSTVMNEDFRWAVLFIGTNDSFQLDDERRISVLSIDEYRRNVRFITQTLREKGARVIQITIPPVDNARLRGFFPDANSVCSEEHIAEVNDFIRRWAASQGHSVADLAQAASEQQGDVLGPDGLHLNARGQRLICELLLELLP
jgi:lysophospholipase L1-like esterase